MRGINDEKEGDGRHNKIKSDKYVMIIRGHGEALNR
jgi:hypothetical protein